MNNTRREPRVLREKNLFFRRREKVEHGRSLLKSVLVIHISQCSVNYPCTCVTHKTLRLHLHHACSRTPRRHALRRPVGLRHLGDLGHSRGGCQTNGLPPRALHGHVGDLCGRGGRRCGHDGGGLAAGGGCCSWIGPTDHAAPEALPETASHARGGVGAAELEAGRCRRRRGGLRGAPDCHPGDEDDADEAA